MSAAGCWWCGGQVSVSIPAVVDGVFLSVDLCVRCHGVAKPSLIRSSGPVDALSLRDLLAETIEPEPAEMTEIGL